MPCDLALSAAPATPTAGHRISCALPALALLFNALVWGVSWWPFRQLDLRGLHPLWATALIYALAVLVISAVRPRSWPELLRTPALWVLVLASGTTNAAFNWAVTSGDVVRVVLLFYLMPLWAVLLARWLLGATLMGGLFLASNLALQYGAARLSASATAVVLVSEVLFASGSAVLLGAGAITLPLLMGGALILGATLLAARQ